VIGSAPALYVLGFVASIGVLILSKSVVINIAGSFRLFNVLHVGFYGIDSHFK
jgi:hypothetical protein